MKGQLVYIKSHQKSILQSEEALRSFKTYGWKIERHAGITPKTLGDHPPIIENSRLWQFKKEKNRSHTGRIDGDSCQDETVLWSL